MPNGTAAPAVTPGLLATAIAIVRESIGAAAFICLVGGFFLYREDAREQAKALIQSYDDMTNAFVALKNESAREAMAWENMVEAMQTGNRLRQVQIDFLKKLYDKNNGQVAQDLCMLEYPF